MIPVTYIKRNISTLSASYKASKKPLHFLLYSKLTIIEAGGWVEMSMDDIVLRCGRRLKQPPNVAHLEKIVEKTWGFDYNKNFRPMLMQAVGFVAVEKIEAAIDGAKFAKMLAALGNLKTARNNVAHTYVKYLTPTAPIPAPGVTTSYFNDIYDGLVEVETVMKGLKLI